MMNEKTLLQRAIEFAAAKHAGQYRKGTTIPYMTHVIEAMEIVCRMTEDEELRAAAVLHDTLEDTKTTKDELVEYFGSRVADLVAAESEDKREDQPEKDTWMARKQETIRHLSHAPTEVRMIALGDKLANVRAMTRDYAVIGEELWQRFNQKNPIFQGMYYGLLANAFGADEFLRETEAYREYVELCAGLFSKEYDGDGNLIEEDNAGKPADGEASAEEGEDDSLHIRCFYADAMDEVRAAMPEGTKAWALIVDRTEDPDMQEIQDMAATLDALMRTDDEGFADVHMQFVNEPGSDDVSWQRTEDGYLLHVCVENGRCWDQLAFQMGYLMTHCLIDHLCGKDREGISWAEELVCEAATLDLLYDLYNHWEETPFGAVDPGYAEAIWDYLQDNLNAEGTSALKKCTNRDELAALNEKNEFDDRLDESHELYREMGDGDLLRLAKIRKYEADGLLLYTHYWRSFSDGSDAVNYLCCLQERIEGCEIPSGISQTFNLKDSHPTADLIDNYGRLIHSLRPLPCEYIIFSLQGSDKGWKDEPGLQFYQVTREKDGRIDAEMRIDSASGRKMYRVYVDDDRAVALMKQILETGKTPETEGWEDITEMVFPHEVCDAEEADDDDDFNDLNEWDIMENILHPDGREDD